MQSMDGIKVVVRLLSDPPLLQTDLLIILILPLQLQRPQSHVKSRLPTLESSS
jgi:hypothetical protein